MIFVSLVLLLFFDRYVRREELIGGWTGDHRGDPGMWRSTSYSRQRIDDLSDFLEVQPGQEERAEQEKAGKQGEPDVLISYQCPITPTVTFKL